MIICKVEFQPRRLAKLQLDLSFNNSRYIPSIMHVQGLSAVVGVILERQVATTGNESGGGKHTKKLENKFLNPKRDLVNRESERASSEMQELRHFGKVVKGNH